MNLLKKNGFTLVELMVTISIIGILAATLAIGYNAIPRDTRSDHAMMLLLSELRSIRSMAISRDETLFVTFEDGNVKLLASDKTTLIRNLIPEDQRFVKTFSGTIPAGAPTSSLVDWAVTDITHPSIKFGNDPLGTISTGKIYLESTEVAGRGYLFARKPNVNNIRLWKWDGSQWHEML